MFNLELTRDGLRFSVRPVLELMGGGGSVAQSGRVECGWTLVTPPLVRTVLSYLLVLVLFTEDR